MSACVATYACSPSFSLPLSLSLPPSAGVVFLAEVNSDLGMSMFHVYPRSGVVTPGDMPFESAVPPTLPDGGIGMGAALPPVGHLTIPTPGEDVFTASVESLAEKGFVKLCAFEPPVKVTAATDDTDTA